MIHFQKRGSVLGCQCDEAFNEDSIRVRTVCCYTQNLNEKIIKVLKTSMKGSIVVSHITFSSISYSRSTLKKTLAKLSPQLPTTLRKPRTISCISNSLSIQETVTDMVVMSFPDVLMSVVAENLLFPFCLSN